MKFVKFNPIGRCPWLIGKMDPMDPLILTYTKNLIKKSNFSNYLQVITLI